MPNLVLNSMVTAGTTVIDTALVAEIVALVKTVMGLFSEFPLNVLLISGLCFVAFGLFARARHAAM